GRQSRRGARCASAARRRARATCAKRGCTKRGRQRREAAMSGFNLSAVAVRERAVTLFLLVAISIAGVVAFLMLGRAEDPSFTIKQMTVVTAWPGATAKEMEELVAERLEKRMQELRWYDRTETFTRPGLAFTTVFLRDSTPPADVPEQFYQARKKLGDEARQLTPAGAIEAKGPQVLIRLDGAIDDLQKIRNTPVAAQGRTLKLADIAEVKRGYEDPATFLIRNNGEPTLLLGVVMREGWNGLDLGKALESE